ncbi:MAG: methyltransferase [Rhodospirillaceae bacterium]
MHLKNRSIIHAAAAVFLGSVAFSAPSAADNTDARLKQAIAGEHRSAEKVARDAYRNPYETLTFFGLKEDMTVLEIFAQGAWYTEVIAPVVANTGKYYAALPDPNVSERSQNSFNSFVETLEANKSIYGDAEATGIGMEATQPIAPGTADLVLTFRNIHNWMGSDTAEKMYEIMYNSAKPGGYLGVVEHRGDPMIKQDPKARSGYVNEGYAIKLAEDAGWQLVASSSINDNPMDDKDYEGRVWRLPPTMRYFGKEGFPNLEGADRQKSLAIGESDRFTLLFVKPKSE